MACATVVRRSRCSQGVGVPMRRARARTARSRRSNAASSLSCARCVASVSGSAGGLVGLLFSSIMRSPMMLFKRQKRRLFG